MKRNLEKRREVMERSMRLGHCICDPRRPCPCDVFREQDLCPCAGERPEPLDTAALKLTQLVRNAGCASKISPTDLETVLARLPQVCDPAVVSGLAAADDAAIYRISDNLCLVQTVDVFTPCVDDPHLFGRICAANCLSDIYAMGGEPRTALSILAFPSETLPGDLMCQMLAGAMQTLGEAGVALIGGHSIKDDEIKLGFAVTGTIDPEVAFALDNPEVGDVLVLTKPLGTGVLAFARQVGREYPEGLAAATRSMATLNRAAAEAMRIAGASACTDVTGFGLFGHLVRMARQKGLTAEIEAGALPSFPGALDALREDVISGAIERNLEFVGGDLQVEPGVERSFVQLGCDAQTSGGLLITVPPQKLERLRRELLSRGAEGFIIGKIVGNSRGCIRLLARADAMPPDQLTTFHAMQSSNTQPSPPTSQMMPQDHEPGCCADIFGGTHSNNASISSTWSTFMKSAQAGGALSEKAKELILFGLVLQSRCGPCFDAHYRRALELGITQAELHEAAWCAVAMGGAPVRVFYLEALARAKTA